MGSHMVPMLSFQPGGVNGRPRGRGWGILCPDLDAGILPGYAKQAFCRVRPHHRKRLKQVDVQKQKWVLPQLHPWYGSLSFSYNESILNSAPIRIDERANLTFINIIAISVALAMDAFAVAIAAGIKLGTVSIRQNFRLAWHFGLFQALMPIIGWVAGLTIRQQIARYDHWVAFALLAFVAQGMYREAFTRCQDQACTNDPTKGRTMVMLSLATSLDALAVGLSLSMLNISVWLPALVIGIVASAFTTLGLHLGKKLSRAVLVRRYADALGATVLVIIGLNILRENGVFDFIWG